MELKTLKTRFCRLIVKSSAHINPTVKILRATERGFALSYITNGKLPRHLKETKPSIGYNARTLLPRHRTGTHWTHELRVKTDQANGGAILVRASGK